MSNNIGKRIKKVRKAKGITQKELAKAIGYSSQQSIARLENADKAPRHEVVEQIAKALNVNIAELYPAIDTTKDNIADLNAAIDKSNNIEITNIALDVISSDLYRLNDLGKSEAIKRIHELTFIEKYTNKE